MGSLNRHVHAFIWHEQASAGTWTRPSGATCARSVTATGVCSVSAPFKHQHTSFTCMEVRCTDVALYGEPLTVPLAQVVLVSSMGICDAENRLNKIGDGNILIWKRRAERYLIARGFPSYTIIHPGGLQDAPVRSLMITCYLGLC